MAIEYIHSSVPSLQRDALLLKLVNNPAFTFVRELNFKYGARVIKSHNDRVFFLAFDEDDKFNAVPFAKVWANDKQNAADKTVTEFCYYSPYYEKERGKSHEDKRTLRGVKLSVLMNTLKKR